MNSGWCQLEASRIHLPCLVFQKKNSNLPSGWFAAPILVRTPGQPADLGTWSDTRERNERNDKIRPVAVRWRPTSRFLLINSKKFFPLRFNVSFSCKWPWKAVSRFKVKNVNNFSLICIKSRLSWTNRANTPTLTTYKCFNFFKNLYRSIALIKLYGLAFGPTKMGANSRKRPLWTVGGHFWPNARSDHVALKRLSIELEKSYRLVCKLIKSASWRAS